MRLNHRPQRPSCCSIKTAILPSRPARAHAVARSGGPGCPQGIAVGDAQRPGRLRARRHSHRRDGRHAQPTLRPSRLYSLSRHNEPVAGCARVFTAANRWKGDRHPADATDPEAVDGRGRNNRRDLRRPGCAGEQCRHRYPQAVRRDTRWTSWTGSSTSTCAAPLSPCRLR